MKSTKLVEQSSTKKWTSTKKWVLMMALGLWVITTVLAFWLMLVIREMILRIYIQYLPASPAGAVVLGTWIWLPLGILFIAVAIGGAEFHYWRVGQPISWKVFGWTLLIQLGILVLALFV